MDLALWIMNESCRSSGRGRLRTSVVGGVRTGFRTWVWLVKITAGVTFFITLMQWAGVIQWLGRTLASVFEPFGLGADGVMVFVTTALANTYAGLGVIATLGVGYREVMILALMGLLCHNMIMETVIQRRAGVSGWGMVLLRVGAALLAAWVSNLFLPADLGGELFLEGHVVEYGSTFWESVGAWAMSMVDLLPFMLLVVVLLNVVQRVLGEFGVLEWICKPFLPLMLLFGLRRGSAVMWLVLNTLGLAYGGAMIYEERAAGRLGGREGLLLNVHVGLSHSLLEDTMIYFSVGLPLLWLLVPRVFLAVVAVWGLRIILRIMGR